MNNNQQSEKRQSKQLKSRSLLKSCSICENYEINSTVNRYYFIIELFLCVYPQLNSLIYFSYNNKSNKMLKIIWVVFSLIIAMIIFYFSQSEDYFPKLIAPFTQIHAIMLGIFGALITFQHSDKQYAKKVKFYYTIILIFLGIYASVNLYYCGIYPWSLMWIVTAIITMNQSKPYSTIEKIQYEIQFQDYSKTIQRQQLNQQTVENVHKASQNKGLKRNVLFILYMLLICLFTYNTKRIADYRTQFPILGHTITMKVPGQHYKVTFHYYCSNIYNSQFPTIILQHGGGGNLAGFMPLLTQLEAKGIKVCVYDRLGYGRSSKFIPHQTLQVKIQITDLLWSLLLRPDEKVIYGGWSAGVELSIAYSYYFPQRINGLIFMDGYPDYLLLQAINSNSSQLRNPHTLLIASIFQFIQPYGFDQLFGGNPIANSTLNHYYEAYYRTGYLWDTQKTELKYMNTTNQISQMGRESGAVLPYPNAQLYLNWPDISVPLLVMPSNNTVSGSSGKQYKIQSEKYIQKCTNSIKRMEIIEGGHDFALVSFEKVSRIISEFVRQINSQR